MTRASTIGRFVWSAILILSFTFPLHAQPAASFEEAVGALKDGDFEAKAEAAQLLSNIDHPRTDLVLRAFLEGRLQKRRSDDLVVFADKIDGSFQLEDAANGETLGTVNRRGVRKLAVNNQLRAFLRELIARRGLTAANPIQRLASVEAMFGSVGASSAKLLEDAFGEESDEAVRLAIENALALHQLRSGSDEEKRSAIAKLTGSVHPAVRGGLSALRDDESLNDSLRASAGSAIVAIEERLELYGAVEVVFFGLSLGSVLVLAAIGLAITFGVMGVINMAHGELIMLGAYTTYVIQLLMPDAIGISIFIAIPAAFLVSGLVGIGIERGVIRFLYGRPLETLLATFGISLVLQQMVRSIFSPLNRSVSAPEWMSGSFEIVAGLSFTYNRMVIFVFSLLVFAAIWLVLQRTRLGLEVRAVAQNRNMARALGVRSAWVDSLTFGFGSGIAGVAGVALSQLTNVGPNLGQSYIVDCFMVVVFGGVGNIWGTLLGGLSLGVANKFLEPFAGAVVAKILILVFIILFIQKRPSGLFPQKGRAAEN